jgi:biotin carboxyl carrier protein
VAATLDGVVAEVAVAPGDIVQLGQTLVAIE